MVRLLIPLLALSLAPMVDETTIEVKNVRPSKIVEQIKQFIPATATAEADDFGSVIKVVGSGQDIAVLQRFVSMFDVKPRSLRINWAYLHAVDEVEINGFANI